MATMARLHAEHVELLPWLEEVRIAGDRVGDVSLDTLKGSVEDVYEFLVAHLIPHAISEDEVLYPEVERLMGAPGATTSMSRDHIEVARLTEELARLRGHLTTVTPGHAQEKLLRRVLYGMYAIVRLHFAKEEEFLVPLLERGLSDEQADRMFAAMDRVEKREREKGLERLHPGSRSLTA